MNTYSFDTFEDEHEISEMVSRLQSEGLIHMKKLDAWDIQEHTEAVKSTEIMAKKVVASL